MVNPILITFNMTPEGPVFSAQPEIDQVQWGTAPTIVWTLAPGSGAEGAQFAPTNGIFFETSDAYPDMWPHQQPQPVAGTNGMQYSVSDPNLKPDQETTTYKYNVNVVFNSKTFSWDPEEENEGKGN